MVEELRPYDHAGMVIDDAYGVNAAALSILRDVRKVAGVRLPHKAEGFLFKGFAVTHVWVAGTFQVVAFA